LRCGNDYRSYRLQFLKLAEQPFADAPLVRRDAANVVGILLNQIMVEIVERATHTVRVLLVDTEDDRLGEPIALF
jgi:hypothetical protein